MGWPLVWYYLGLVAMLSAIIWFGCCVVLDYYTYLDLQRRLHEEKRKELA
jgi:hypothetical protein